MKVTLGTTLVKINKWLCRKNVYGDMTYIFFEYILNLKKIPNLVFPSRLNEKLQLYKKYIKHNNIEFYTMIADKILVRDFVNKIPNLNLIPLVGIVDDINNYDFSKLNKPIVIKSNHSSGHYDIIKNPSIITTEEWERKKVKYISWLSENFYLKSKEPQYNLIEPKIFIEELLQPNDGNDLIDYKFHCINGVVEFIHVASDRTGKTKRNFFDTNWLPLDFYWGPLNKDGSPARSLNHGLKKPKLLEIMLSIAAEASLNIPYVRVDLYEHNDKIYFGELTLHPGSGYEPFIPDQTDFYYGKKLTLK
jgi:hypothetical protein